MMCQYGCVCALFSFLFLGLLSGQNSMQEGPRCVFHCASRYSRRSLASRASAPPSTVGAPHTLAAGAVPSCEDADIAEEAAVQVVEDDAASNVPVHAVVPNGRLQAHAADPPLAYAAMELLNAKLLEAQSTMTTATTSIDNSDLAEPLRAVEELLAAERGSTVAALQSKAAVEVLNSDFYCTYPRLHQRVGVGCGIEVTALKAPSCCTCSALHLLKPNPGANEFSTQKPSRRSCPEYVGVGVHSANSATNRSFSKIQDVSRPL
ncbi:hypothetical protein C8R45DRAFT_1163520 [Mycena sanguinolenta]|nr:hypothetical protein C8R45DRAFT_1163520 [Mycena sanguinolenta]